MAKTKYMVNLTFGYSGGRARKGSVVELDDDEAKQFHKVNAIGLYLPDGETEAAELPKPKRPKRAKPASPVALDDSKTLTPDPKAQ